MKRFVLTLAFVAVLGSARAQDLDALQEQTIKAAVARVAPTVVAIETVGGTDVIIAGPQGQRIRKGSGPTTGLIVSAPGVEAQSRQSVVRIVALRIEEDDPLSS